MFQFPVSRQDIESIFSRSEKDFLSLRDQSLLITGATGFFGQWIVQSLTEANKEFELNLQLHLLSRDWQRVQKNNPQWKPEDFVHLYSSDVRELKLSTPCQGIIHAANEARPSSQNDDEFIDVVERGTQNILDLAETFDSEKVLITSSGAVYGDEIPLHVSEDHKLGAASTTYARAKQKQEKMAMAWAENRKASVLIARCFAFLGPYLPLDGSYAAGNFILNTLRQEPIVIRGDGQALRSYMYPSDLVSSLLALMARGESGRPYNLGSSEPISIYDLAKKIAAHSCENLPIQVEQNNPISANPPAYVPSVARAEKELGIQATISLDQAIEKTLKWHQSQLG